MSIANTRFNRCIQLIAPGRDSRGASVDSPPGRFAGTTCPRHRLRGAKILRELIEVGDTDDIFTNPRHKLTEDYITGRFG